jgi:membrane protein insertase Oxa1/YidC/SpoIIIJ
MCVMSLPSLLSSLLPSVPKGLFVYWTANNLISVGQTIVLRQPALKKLFNIPDAPLANEAPAMKFSNPFSKLMEVKTSISIVLKQMCAQQSGFVFAWMFY